MSDTKPLILILGATGRTGKCLVNGLLASGKFRIAATTRAVSLDSEPVQKLRSRGVEVRVADIDTDSPEKLQATLAGVDILVSAVKFSGFLDQIRIFEAAKAVGTVKRVVPCDWATPGGRGTRFFHDWKIDIHEYIKASGLPYTIIDVGWWSQLLFPLPREESSSPDPFRDIIVGTGAEYKLLVTDMRNIGVWAARILADDRTLNQHVIAWEWELTHLQAREIGERVYGETGGDPEALKRTRQYVSAEEIKAQAAAAEAARLKAPEDPGLIWNVVATGFQLSMFVLNEASYENAKRLGYLDAQELYPDMKFASPEEFAKEQLKDPQGVWAQL